MNEIVCREVSRLQPKAVKAALRSKFSPLFQSKSVIRLGDVLLTCETCGSDNPSLVLCFGCLKIFCVEHGYQHTTSKRGGGASGGGGGFSSPSSSFSPFGKNGNNNNNNGNCSILLSCHDCHIWCACCDAYLYPRELAFTSKFESHLTPIVEEWMQILGRTRLWWRELPIRPISSSSSSSSFIDSMFSGSSPLSPIVASFVGSKQQQQEDDEEEEEEEDSTNSKKKSPPPSPFTPLPYIPSEDRVPFGLRGIRNFGNTCFFTSSLQAMVHSTSVRRHLAQFDEENSMENRFASVAADILGSLSGNERKNEKKEKEENKEKEPPIQEQLRLLCEQFWDRSFVSRKIKLLRGEDESTIVPEQLWRALAENAIFGQYSKDSMEDANTLLIDLLNGMNDKLVASMCGISIENRVTCAFCHKKRQACQSFLSRSFRAKFSGSEGAFPPAALEKIATEIVPRLTPRKVIENSISLGISEGLEEKKEEEEEKKKEGDDGDVEMEDDGKNHDETKPAFPEFLKKRGAEAPPLHLSDALSDYFSSEAVEDYVCEFCKQKGQVSTETLLLNPLPPLLIFQIKRFEPIGTGIQVKSHRRVILPETLSIPLSVFSSSTPPPPTPPSYSLSSIIVHDGGMGGGHYMTYVRLAQNQFNKNNNKNDQNAPKWMWFSDQYLGFVEESEVLNSEAYIAFYEREGEVDRDDE